MKFLRNISVFHMSRLKYAHLINNSIFQLVAFITIIGIIGVGGQDNTLSLTNFEIEIDPSDPNYLQMALRTIPLFPKLMEDEHEISHGTNTTTTSPILVPKSINHQTVQNTHLHPPKELIIHNHTKNSINQSSEVGVSSLAEIENWSSSDISQDIRLQSAAITGSKSGRRAKRSVVHLYDMIVCSTGCNPLAYKGYGCYCGFLGSGLTVDGIDRCCAKHDFCYHVAKCPQLLTYFVPYYWTCNDGRPNCVSDYRGWKGVCGAHLCECDRQFAECLKKYPCPRARAMCVTSPFRYFQNLVMQPLLLPYG